MSSISIFLSQLPQIRSRQVPRLWQRRIKIPKSAFVHEPHGYFRCQYPLIARIPKPVDELPSAVRPHGMRQNHTGLRDVLPRCAARSNRGLNRVIYLLAQAIRFIFRGELSAVTDDDERFLLICSRLERVPNRSQ
jgi:hypothetical protein